MGGLQMVNGGAVFKSDKLFSLYRSLQWMVRHFIWESHCQGRPLSEDVKNALKDLEFTGEMLGIEVYQCSVCSYPMERRALPYTCPVCNDDVKNIYS